VKAPRRKITYRLYPGKKQREKLEETCELHRQLYNAVLQQRIEAYQRRKVSLKFSDQCRELTSLRREFSEYGALNAQSCQVTLKRVDLAFQHFFRRIRQGSSRPGFPRFKSLNRFKGFGYKSHGDGFKVVTDGKHGSVRLSGIGTIQIRGKARIWGTPVTAEVLRKDDKWYIAVTVECTPVRASGKKALAFDWGVETFATLAVSDGSFDEVKNPRFLKKALKNLKSAQRSLSRKKRNSENRNDSRKRVVRLHQKIANQRKNFAHQTSAHLVKESAFIATEELDIKNMTAHGGSYKKGLNREILNTAPAMFISFLRYKAEEAHIRWTEIPTRQVKPSQTCSGCGNQEKKSLSMRLHSCEKCKLKLSRDQNSARVILNWALLGNASGWEPTCWGETKCVSMNQETPAIATPVA
jgi:putative transposase